MVSYSRVCVGVLAVWLGGCAHSVEPIEREPEPRLVELIESFRGARDAGELERARAMLASDPRVWYDTRDEGLPWRLGGGRWRTWDEHFKSESKPGPWIQNRSSDGEVVLYRVVEEWNEYFDLIERTDKSEYRLTYFFEPANAKADTVKIKGYMISSAHPGSPEKPRSDRFDEIEAWAVENRADEWAYLRPGGRLDPTGDRAERTRALINIWRLEVGLQPIE